MCSCRRRWRGSLSASTAGRPAGEAGGGSLVMEVATALDGFPAGRCLGESAVGVALRVEQDSSVHEAIEDERGRAHIT